MSRRKDTSVERKAEIVQAYIRKKIGIVEAARRADVNEKTMAAGMKQSRSRVAHCIDNSPMEGFWGILKRERYYGRRFTCKEELLEVIHDYIAYYNNRRVQRNLGILTPAKKHEQFYLVTKIFCRNQKKSLTFSASVL